MSDSLFDDPRRANTVRALSLGFVALHVYHARSQDGGGWKARHGGLWGAIVAFFRQSKNDPVMSAGLSDFAVVAVVLGTKLLYTLPPETRWSPRTKAWLVLYTVFPGLGALVFPLVMKPQRLG